MRILSPVLAFILSVGFAASGFAEDVVVSESDTGVVFGDLNCQPFDHKTGNLALDRDMFDYLTASVAVEISCVTRDGNQWIMQGTDQVIFPTLTFDWMTQSWLQGDRAVASWVNNQVVLADGLDTTIWSNLDPNSVAFKVQFVEAN